MTLDGQRMGGLAGVPDASVEDAQREIRRLREHLARMDVTIQSLRDRCEDLEEDKAHLGRLAVASAQLHESAARVESLRNLQDVLVNLIGSEEIAIWSISADGRALDLRASQGITEEPWRCVGLGEGAVGKAAASGEVLVSGAAGPGEPTVCIPLKLGAHVVGVVAVFRPLTHRGGFTPQDHDVFDLVARQAAFALCCADASFRAGESARDG